MNYELTKKQKNLLEIITSYIDDNKIAPTTRELGEITGLKSTSTIHGYLERLKAKGYITWQEGFPRTLRVLKK